MKYEPGQKRHRCQPLLRNIAANRFFIDFLCHHFDRGRAANVRQTLQNVISVRRDKFGYGD